MTRANISVVIDGKVYAAYINYDGKPSYVGSLAPSYIDNDYEQL